MRRRGLTDATSYCKRRSDSDPSQRSVDGSRLPESGRGWRVHRNAAPHSTVNTTTRLTRLRRGIAKAVTRLLGEGSTFNVMPADVHYDGGSEADFGHDDQGQGLRRRHL